MNYFMNEICDLMCSHNITTVKKGAEPCLIVYLHLHVFILMKIIRFTGWPWKFEMGFYNWYDFCPPGWIVYVSL